MQFPLLTQFYPFHLHMPPPVFPAALPVGLGSENATLLVLCRESDLSGILSSMKTVESRFNDNYGYPWTFLNEKEFSTEFKEWVLLAPFLLVTLTFNVGKSVQRRGPQSPLVLFRVNIGTSRIGLTTIKQNRGG